METGSTKQLDSDELKKLWKECSDLYDSDQITTENAYSLNLIDNVDGVLQMFESLDDYTAIQSCGKLIDVMSKIYSCRGCKTVEEGGFYLGLKSEEEETCSKYVEPINKTQFPSVSQPQQSQPEPELIQIDDSDDEVTFLEDSSTSPYEFVPVNHNWQLEKCVQLNLQLKKRRMPKQTNVLLTRPKTFTRVDGDGNCFFRCISVAITGVEDSHRFLRRNLIKFMRKRCVSDYLKVHHTQDSVESHIKSTKMNKSCTWATDCEIIAMAGYLQTNIFVFSQCGNAKSWQKFSAKICSPMCSPSHYSIYLQHEDDHYDVVRSVAK